MWKVSKKSDELLEDIKVSSRTSSTIPVQFNLVLESPPRITWYFTSMNLIWYENSLIFWSSLTLDNVHFCKLSNVLMTEGNCLVNVGAILAFSRKGAKISNTTAATFYDHNLLDLTVDTKALLWTNQIVLMAATWICFVRKNYFEIIRKYNFYILNILLGQCIVVSLQKCHN